MYMIPRIINESLLHQFKVIWNLPYFRVLPVVINNKMKNNLNYNHFLARISCISAKHNGLEHKLNV